MKLKYLLFAIVLFSGIQLFAQQNYSKVRIYTDIQGINKIQKLGIDLESLKGKPEKFIELEISENEIKKISENGFKYDIIIKDMSKFYRERYSQSVIKNNNSLKGVNYVTPINFNYGSMGGFLTLDEVYAELDEMTNLYPNLISAKYTIGNTQTNEGRNIYAIKISDNPNVNESEPEVLYTSLTHAREPAAMQALIWYMWYFLENYGTNDEITYLVDNLELYFIPVVNPDGYEYNYSTDPNGGGMWRKNKRDNNGGGFSEYYDGVDLNRNYGFKWGYDDIGSSPDQTSSTYRGASAFSEPETQIIRDFTNQHEFLLAHNHHTYSELIIIPYGYEEIHSPDDNFLRTSAYLMASENEYTVGQGWEILYTVNGDADDWMYGEQTSKPKIMAYTQETGQSFWPSQSQIIPLCEESYLSNLYLARFATPYAELSDNSPNYVSRTGYLKYNIKRMGLSGNGNYTVTITPDNAVFSSLGNTQNIVLAETLNEKSDSISYVLSNNIQYGDEFSYTVTVSQGSYSLSKTFTKSYYETEIIIKDEGDDLNNWTTSGWSVTSENYHSASNSITDSEGGNYTNNVSSAITLTNEIDLTGIENPHLTFWAKWNIESDWDYVQFSISTNNGSTWTPVTTNNTNPGEGSFQPSGEPVYDGASVWVQEMLDLSSYVNQSVKFRFELHSDVSVTDDGFYFDDFTVSSTLTSPLSASITVEAGCGANSGTATIYSTMTGTQTFYLKDDAGNPVNNRTGDASSHQFTGLSNRIYRGQVEKGVDISTLSNPAELINVTEVSVAPSYVNASETSACLSAGTTLSYSGGSGSIFNWYAGSCGNILTGNGNNLVVYPTSETTYYGRWENACGNSSCEQVTVSILPETNIISQPQDVNTVTGSNVSFYVTAEGNNITYQWQKNSSNISGATSATYTINNAQVSDAGDYNVTINGDCGSVTSEIATLSIASSVKNIQENLFTIFPNPSKGNFNIHFSEISKNVAVEITDISGKTISNSFYKEVNQSGIRINDLSEGFYFINITIDNLRYSKKLIIN
ncbi:MAG: immune inhibitor A [Bacteroidales bacterium]|nr:immune inhibitor A [Bacteroidales bacterium]